MTASSLTRWYRASFVLYLAIVATASAIGSTDPGRNVGVGLAVACALAFSLPVVLWMLRSRATEGVERTIGDDSAIAAFHATMIAMVTYGLFEQFAGAPRLTMYVPFVFGVAAWTLAWGLVRRRLS